MKFKDMTLLEVMVATMVLSIAILGTFSVFISIANLNALTKEKTFVLNCTRSLLEEIRSTNFDEVLNSFNNYNFSIYGINPQKEDSDKKPGKITVEQVQENPPLLEVTIKTDWQSIVGNQSFVVITRIMKME